MPIDFPDKLRSTRADGLLVDAGAIDGTLNKAQLHADTGIPSYVTGAVAYAQDTGRFTAAIAAIQAGNQIPKPSIVFMYAPNVDNLPRGSTNINVMLNSEASLQLVNIVGANVKARDITPGMLLEGIIVGSQITLVEPLPVRPQDYRIVFVMGSASDDTDLAAADVSSARAAVSATTSGAIDINAARTAANIGTFPLNDLRYAWIGVPDDAPDILGYGYSSDEAAARRAEVTDAVIIPPATQGLARYTDAEPQYNGVDYKWWRTHSGRAWFPANRYLRVVQGSYGL